jgi:kynurenine formamidase
MSPDRCGSQDCPAHYVLLPERTMILENLANLDRLPPFSLFLALPLKILGGSGSPLRAIGFVPKTADN